MPDPEGFKAGSAWMDVKPNIDETEWHAKIAAALEGASAGGAPQITAGLSKSVEDARPAVARDADRLGKSIADGITSGLSDGQTPIMDEAERLGKGIGTTTGNAFVRNFGTEIGDQIQDKIDPQALIERAWTEPIGTAGQRTGDQFATKFSDQTKRKLADASLAGILADALGPAAGPAADTVAEKVKTDLDEKLPPALKEPAEKAGKEAGAAAANGLSPLILSAFAAAGAFGPALLLTGTAGAMLGVGALISRSNADIQAEYKTLASDVGRDLTGAVAPLAPAIQASMVQADTAVQQLAPVLKQTFADAEPDLTAFTKGVTGLASSALPGVRDAIDQSRGIVTGFTGSLPTLGSGIGRFFTGLTTNAQSTQTGIVDFVDVTSNVLGTLGHVAGSASAALSTDFAAVTPVLNTTLAVIDKLASPQVVGGLLGVAGALKFDPAISGGLQKISNGLTSVAAKADGSSGLLGKAGGAAESAAGGFGKMADIMGGPWGIAVGAGIGLLGGLVSNLTQGVASVSDFTAAVASDNGVVGASTTATIQKKLATLDLKTAQDDLGVSQTTLIEYAAGDASAQKTVREAYDKKVASLKAAGQVSAQNTAATVQGNIAAKAEADRLRDVIGNVDAVTEAVKGALKEQNDQNQAYLAATRSAGIFAGMVDTATTALQTNAQQTAISTVASLQLGDGQAQLGQDLSNILYNYQLAADGAQGYGTVMTAMNGTTSQLDDAQNTLAQDVLNAGKSFKANKYSLDLSTQAGINNRQALSAASKAIIQMGVDQYQASGSIDQANNTIKQQIDKFVTATGATGKAKKAIEDYLGKITQIPPGVATTVTANTGPAQNSLLRLVEQINKSSGTVTIYSNSKGLFAGGKALGANAGGGPVTAGTISTINEHGDETVLFGQDAYVLTHGQTTAMRSAPPGKTPTGTAPTAASTVNFNYYGPQAPSPEQQAQIMRDLAGVLT